MPPILSGLARALRARATDRDRAPRLLDPVLQREAPEARLDVDSLRARVKSA